MNTPQAPTPEAAQAAAVATPAQPATPKKGGLLQQLAAALTPNKAVSSKVVYAITVTWASAFVAWWWFVSPRVVPKPPDILNATVRLWTERSMFTELLSSLTLNLEAIGIATIISLGLAYLTVVPAARPFVALVSKLRFLGLTGLTFIFGLAVNGRPLQVWILVFGVTVFYVTNMASVIASVPKEKFDHARTLRMGPWRVVHQVVVRGTFDQALEMLRQNMAMGWVMLTMVEGLVRSEGGIGVLMLNENKMFHLDGVFAIQIHILVVGLMLDYCCGAAKNLLCPWATIKLERS